MAKLTTPVYLVNGKDVIPPGTAISVSSPIPPDIRKLIRLPVQNAGSKDMRVDGSTTPVEFTYNADPVANIRLYEFRVVLGTKRIEFDGNSFAADDSLTNGILFQITDSYGSNELANVARNEDFLLFPNTGAPVINFGGTYDYIVTTYNLSGVLLLRGGSSDKLSVVIRDDLTAHGLQLTFLECQVYGIAED